MKKIVAMMLCACMMLGLVGCGGGDTAASNRVVIYTSDDEESNAYFVKRLNEQFPNYDIVMQYLPTGNNAASLKDMLADLSAYDTSRYMPDLVDKDHKYLVFERVSSAIVINPEILADKGLPTPKSYQDLLDPQYKGLISMPSPKSSGTGYTFLLNLVNVMGQEQALAYFDKLSENILQFTSSGSGPVSAVVQGEAAIGLGMTYQAVQEINKGVNLEILYFEEGAPYTTYGIGVVEGRLEDPAVKEVFEFIINDLISEDKEKFNPEKIYKDQNTVIENFPQDIPYADMTGIEDQQKKEELLSLWQY